MNVLKKLREREKSLAIVGLGYVGLPLAVAFAKHYRVIGFDNNKRKIESYQMGHDVTGEVGDKALISSPIEFTSDEEKLSEAIFVIVAVPTPIHDDKTPDLTAVKNASKMIANQLQKGTVVVYESTVYPGVTEKICLPILEKVSGLRSGYDFKVGYSPERINPGDKKHRLQNIVKIVSGEDIEACQIIKSVYDTVVEHTYPVSSIKVAEAAKLVENAQRDINIAFMNELAQVFHRMGIDTIEVIRAMNTKWNALDFYPGLVGGHCIGVDPYYFIYQAENLGYHSQLIATGRRINNDMSQFIVQEVVRMMFLSKINLSDANIVLLGMTFKENCADTRNSKSVDIYRRLESYGLRPMAVDPWADKETFFCEYGINLTNSLEIEDADCIMILVAHDDFKLLEISKLKHMFRDGDTRLLIDVKNIYDRREMESAGFTYWAI